MVSARLTGLRGKAAMVTGARPPDLITVGVAGSCLVDRAPVVGRLESRKALWAVVGNRVPANLRQFPARLVETVADAGTGDRDGQMALPVPIDRRSTRLNSSH